MLYLIVSDLSSSPNIIHNSFFFLKKINNLLHGAQGQTVVATS